MGRRKVDPPTPPHRPAIKIDWKKVDDLMVAGCNAREVAGYFGISDDTLYTRFKIEHKGSTFTEVMAKRKAGGHAMLRAKQFQTAMRGSNMMLKLLGEEWLNQGKDASINNTELVKRFDEIIDYYNKRQEVMPFDSVSGSDAPSEESSSENNSDTTSINE